MNAVLRYGRLWALSVAVALGMSSLAPAATMPVATYSIVARDAATGQFGVAVQSHWFSVGPIVPWAQVDDQGRVWCGTSGEGVIRFESGTWNRYTTANSGLAGRECGKIGRGRP